MKGWDNGSWQQKGGLVLSTSAVCGPLVDSTGWLLAFAEHCDGLSHPKTRPVFKHFKLQASCNTVYCFHPSTNEKVKPDQEDQSISVFSLRNHMNQEELKTVLLAFFWTNRDRVHKSAYWELCWKGLCWLCLLQKEEVSNHTELHES